MLLLYVALGGAAGALARYGLGGWVQDRAGLAFPWGTFVVNAFGCLLIGFALPYLEGVRLGHETRAFVAVGVLGGFTTFSTFSYETVALLEEGVWARAVGYSFGSLGVGLVAVYVGILLSAYALQAKL